MRWCSLMQAVLLFFAPSSLLTSAMAEDSWVTYQPAGNAGGKHIVLVSGDEEYRSEQVLPALARILATHHGFKCTVLFAVDPKDGTINPNVTTNIPGLQQLDSADLLVMFIRFRNLPDDQMAHFDRYFKSGKPIVGFRTATHAFQLPAGSTYEKYSWKSKAESWDGGFGKRVLGETWVAHHGKHGKESTRGVIAPGAEGHPILRGIKNGDVWGPTDVYRVTLPLPGDSKPLLLGEVLTGMKQDDPAVVGPVNDPKMPIAWVKSYDAGKGTPGRVFTSTLAAGQDFESEAVRRLFVNACYWALGQDDKIPAMSKVDFVGEYKGLPFKNNGFTPGIKPATLSSGG
jgi:type 1 glutamine amidotransferase